MVCFCKTTATRLGLLLPSLNVSAQAAASIQAHADLNALAALLAALGLPAAPWVPERSWIDLALPMPRLNASAIATISAAAHLRAQVLAHFGIDLLIPGQANAFIRLAATLSARLSVMSPSLHLGLGLTVWPRLALTMQAIARVEAALTMGLFIPTAPAMSFAAWNPFVVRLRLLLPLLSLSANLGINLSANFAADLSLMLSAMVRIRMPTLPIPTMTLMASLSASLTAIAQLRLALGVNPLEIGLPAIHAMITARLQVVARLGMSMHGMDWRALLALLPRLKLEFNPGAIATPAMVAAALTLNVHAVESINWNVPVAASLPILSVGLPILSLSLQLKETLALTATAAPCGAICDGQSLLSATLAA